MRGDDLGGEMAAIGRLMHAVVERAVRDSTARPIELKGSRRCEWEGHSPEEAREWLTKIPAPLVERVRRQIESEG